MNKTNKKHIFVFGQCTMHWGRMEFGNIGNCYIIRPMFRQLRKEFPDAEISTTMQFSKGFCDELGIRTVPMELYYDFDKNDNLAIAKRDYECVCGNETEKASAFVKELENTDLAIDFSGDIWGDNADFLGKDRFETGLYKDAVAQKLCRTAMIAGSPGPFNAEKDLVFTKKVFAGFDFVSNREPISSRMLNDMGFCMQKVHDFACPSFLFEGTRTCELSSLSKEIFHVNKLKIGVVLCGWNFEKGPYSRWPRDDCEYDKFILMIKNLIKKYDAKIYLMSHSNGFNPPPAPFQLKHGRDYPIMEQLKRLLNDENVILLDGVYTAEDTKGIVSNFDILISGRMHGAVAGLSQCIPTVILDYGHKPIAHKLRGFAEVTGMDKMIASPTNLQNMISVTEYCVEKRDEIHKHLLKTIPIVKESATEQFKYLHNFI